MRKVLLRIYRSERLRAHAVTTGVFFGLTAWSEYLDPKTADMRAVSMLAFGAFYLGYRAYQHREKKTEVDNKPVVTVTVEPLREKVWVPYRCGVCKSPDRSRYLTCNYAGCPDGRG